MKQERGFTLIEILIALTIFSIMAVMGTSVLYTVFRAKDSTTAHTERLGDIQIAMVMLERDLIQAVENPLSLQHDTIEFSRGGVQNPLAQEKLSTLMRVKYRIQNNTLIRTANRLNLPIGRFSGQDIDTPILERVDKLRLTYIDKRFQTHEVWRSQQLPIAIRVTLQIQGFGEISEFYLLPHATLLKVPLASHRLRREEESL